MAKELKFGQWAWVWCNKNPGKFKRIYLGEKNGKIWAVRKPYSKEFNKNGLIQALPWDHAEPYELEIDWRKVPSGTFVEFSSNGEVWCPGHLACFIWNPKVKDRYAIYWDVNKHAPSCPDEATGIMYWRYCRIPDNFEIPEEWLKDE